MREFFGGKRLPPFYFMSIALCVITSLSNGEIHSKGQFWASGYIGDDAPRGQSAFESTVGYIPTLSTGKDFSNNILLDMEWAFRTVNTFSGDSLLSDYYKTHRAWIRLATEKLDIRLGLQKIIFGPAQVLGSLAWFDTFDLTDPTGQTDGVEALRLRWFPSNSLSMWSWAILDENDYFSFGGRAEFSSALGEWGLSLHHDPSDSLRMIGQSGVLIQQPHNRLAIDFRYDGFIGFWNESALILSNESEIGLITIGSDYTVPLGKGILVMAEFMHIAKRTTVDTATQNFTAFMASVPLGIIHQIMFISQVNLTDNQAYQYIRWSSTYDRISLNFILSMNPKRDDYTISPEYLPNSAVGFGSGFQFIFIYNH